MDTLGFEPRAFCMRSGCDTTTPCALERHKSEGHMLQASTSGREVGLNRVQPALFSSTPCSRALARPSCPGRGDPAWSWAGAVLRKGVEMEMQMEMGTKMDIDMDTLRIEPRASRMLSGCDTTTPRALGMPGQKRISLFFFPKAKSQRSFGLSVADSSLRGQHSRRML